MLDQSVACIPAIGFLSDGNAMWLTLVLLASLIAALIAGLRFPNAVGSWGVALVLLAVPLLAGVVSAPSRFNSLADLTAYLPFVSDLTLLLVGLSAIVVLDCATARRAEGGSAVFWIGLIASLATLSFAMHWNSSFRLGGQSAATISDVSVLLSYVAGMLILSLALRLATAKE